MPTQTITITDRNETKYLFAVGYIGKPLPRGADTLHFTFNASESFFGARRADSLNHSVPVLSFIEASRHVDRLIYEHRHGMKRIKGACDV